MSSVVTRRTRARGAQLFRGSSRHRREAIASAAKAFWRSETHRGLPTGTIALRRRRVGLTTLAAVVDERAFGFAGDVAVAFRVRGSMFSLFSSSQLAYARCCWGLALVRFRPGLPFCGAHFLAASSGPIFHLRCARTAGSGPFFTRARTVGGQLSVRATVFKRPPTRPRERRVRTALWMASDASVPSMTGSAQVGGTWGSMSIGAARTMVPSTAVGPALRKSAGPRRRSHRTRRR